MISRNTPTRSGTIVGCASFSRSAVLSACFMRSMLSGEEPERRREDHRADDKRRVVGFLLRLRSGSRPGRLAGPGDGAINSRDRAQPVVDDGFFPAVSGPGRRWRALCLAATVAVENVVPHRRIETVSSATNAGG